IGGEMIPQDEVVRFVEKNKQFFEHQGLSFFEMTAAMAFDYFAQSDVEVAVIETGLGGRLDATNLILPVVSVITNIGLEHTALLGHTLPEIAREKGGIIKKSIPVVIGEGDPRYNGTLEEMAAATRSKVIYAEQEFSCESQSQEACTQCFSLCRTRDGYHYELDIDLMGIYQRRNLVTAAAVADYLHEWTPLTISRRAFVEGVRWAAKDTSLFGRWQKLADRPLTICDTGHNAHGIRYVAEQIAATPHERLFCVVGFVRDKDLEHILPLLPRQAHYIFTAAKSDRAIPAEELAATAARFELQGEVVADVKEAVARAQALAAEEDMIFIGGSTYVVAEAM
ncbi:MAG: bifunctional folylpolyglutamate synthase/dihydrofolate synthase, partial [Alistipes sp.]|nr:bifunctional folylpolyglutamate synthase/dihydrofolate synthase [Alistipes sp.]